ncbi:MAG: hypothetical protein JWQ09_1498, partial [Segetibacter sp.]|nr:hypothetical protein [Segetibacter sp.]
MVFIKPGKKFSFIISIAAILIVTGYVFYRIKKHDFLDHQLQDLVKDKTNQLYNISYDSIYVDEVGGDLYIKNIYIKGDTARQLRMINSADTNAAAVIFDMYVPMLKVVDFKTARALLSKQLQCSQIIISNPHVNIYLFPGQDKQKDSKKNREELYKQVLGNFKLIKADSVSVMNGEVTASDFFTKEVKFHTLNTTVNLSQVAIDSTYNQDTSRTLFCKEIAITSEKIVLGEKKNTAEISHATFDTRSKIVAFSTFGYDAFKNNGFFKSKLEGISLQGIEWLGPVENSELIIDKAVIDKGEIETLLKDEKENKNKGKKEGTILTGWIRKFALNSLQVKSVNFTSRTTEVKKKPFIVKNNAFSLKHINIDRTSKLDESLLKQTEEIELTNDEISIKSGDKLYEYKALGVKLNSRKKSIIIKSLKVIPQLNEAAFVKKKHYQTDRYDINFRDINCSNVNVEKLVKGEVDIGNISTTGSLVKVFRDLSYPIDSISKQGQQMTYPHQIIHTLGLLIKINRFIFNNTYVEYKEKNPRSNSSGRVRFVNSYVTIHNISTLKAKAGEKMTVNFRSNFLEEIPVTGGFTFSLDNWQKGIFTAEASISNSVDATILNQLTQPMSLVQVEKGTINSVKFYMKADTNTSNGTFVMPYQGLKISLLKKK